MSSHHSKSTVPEVEADRSQSEHPHLFSFLSELKDLEHRSEDFIQEKLSSFRVAVRMALEGDTFDILKEMEHDGKAITISEFLRQEWLQLTKSPVLRTFVRDTEHQLATAAARVVEHLISNRRFDLSRLVLLLAIPFTTGNLNEHIWEQLFDPAAASRGEEEMLTKDVVQLLIDKVMTEARQLWLKTKPQILKLAEDYFRKLGRKGERVAKEVLDYLHHVIPTVGKAGTKNAVIKSRHSKGVVWLKKKFVGDKAKHSVPTVGDVGDEKRKGHTISLSKLSPIDGDYESAFPRSPLPDPLPSPVAPDKLSPFLSMRRMDKLHAHGKTMKPMLAVKPAAAGVSTAAAAPSGVADPAPSPAGFTLTSLTPVQVLKRNPGGTDKSDKGDGAHNGMHCWITGSDMIGLPRIRFQDSVTQEFMKFSQTDSAGTITEVDFIEGDMSGTRDGTEIWFQVPLEFPRTGSYQIQVGLPASDADGAPINYQACPVPLQVVELLNMTPTVLPRIFDTVTVSLQGGPFLKPLPATPSDESRDIYMRIRDQGDDFRWKGVVFDTPNSLYSTQVDFIIPANVADLAVEHQFGLGKGLPLEICFGPDNPATKRFTNYYYQLTNGNNEPMDIARLSLTVLDFGTEKSLFPEMMQATFPELKEDTVQLHFSLDGYETYVAAMKNPVLHPIPLDILGKDDIQVLLKKLDAPAGSNSAESEVSGLVVDLSSEGQVTATFPRALLQDVGDRALIVGLKNTGWSPPLAKLDRFTSNMVMSLFDIANTADQLAVSAKYFPAPPIGSSLIIPAYRVEIRGVGFRLCKSLKFRLTNDQSQSIDVEVQVHSSTQLVFNIPSPDTLQGRTCHWVAAYVPDDVGSFNLRPEVSDFYSWWVDKIDPPIVPSNISQVIMSRFPPPSIPVAGNGDQQTWLNCIALTGDCLGVNQLLTLRLGRTGQEVSGIANDEGKIVVFPIPTISLCDKIVLELRMPGCPFVNIGSVDVYSVLPGPIISGASLGGTPIILPTAGLDASVLPDHSDVRVSFGFPASDESPSIAKATLQEQDGAIVVKGGSALFDTTAVVHEISVTLRGGENSDSATDLKRATVDLQMVRPVRAIDMGPIAGMLRQPLFVSVNRQPWIDINQQFSYHLVGSVLQTSTLCIGDVMILQGFNFIPGGDYTIALVPSFLGRKDGIGHELTALLPATALNLSQITFSFQPKDKTLPMVYDVFLAAVHCQSKEAIIPEYFAPSSTSLNYFAFPLQVCVFDANGRQPFEIRSSARLVKDTAVDKPNAFLFFSALDIGWDLKVTATSSTANAASVMHGTTDPVHSTGLSAVEFGFIGKDRWTNVGQLLCLFYRVDKPIVSAFPAGANQIHTFDIAVTGSDFPDSEGLLILEKERHVMKASVMKSAVQIRNLLDGIATIPSFVAYLKITSLVDASYISFAVGSIESSSLLNFKGVQNLPAGELNCFIVIAPEIANITVDSANVVDSASVAFLKTLNWPTTPNFSVFGYSAETVYPPFSPTSHSTKLQIFGQFSPAFFNDTVLVRITPLHSFNTQDSRTSRVAQMLDGEVGVTFWQYDGESQADPFLPPMVDAQSQTFVETAKVLDLTTLEFQCPAYLPPGQYAVEVRLGLSSERPYTLVKSALFIYSLNSLRYVNYGAVQTENVVSINGIFHPALMGQPGSDVVHYGNVLFGPNPQTDSGVIVSVSATQVVVRTPRKVHAHGSSIFFRAHSNLPYEELTGTFTFIRVDPLRAYVLHVAQQIDTLCITGACFPADSVHNKALVRLRVQDEEKHDHQILEEQTASITSSVAANLDLVTSRLRPGLFIEGEISFDSMTYLPIPSFSIFTYQVDVVGPTQAAFNQSVFNDNVILNIHGHFQPSAATPEQDKCMYFVHWEPFIFDAVTQSLQRSSTAEQDSVVVLATNNDPERLTLSVPQLIQSNASLFSGLPVKKGTVVPYAVAQLRIGAVTQTTFQLLKGKLADSTISLKVINPFIDWQNLNIHYFYRRVKAIEPMFCFSRVTWDIALLGVDFEPLQEGFVMLRFTNATGQTYYSNGDVVDSSSALVSVAAGMPADEYNVDCVWLDEYFTTSSEIENWPADLWLPVVTNFTFHVVSELKMDTLYAPINCDGSGGDNSVPLQLSLDLPPGTTLPGGATIAVEVAFTPINPTAAGDPAIGEPIRVQTTMNSQGVINIFAPTVGMSGPYRVSATFPTEQQADPIVIPHAFTFYEVDQIPDNLVLRDSNSSGTFSVGVQGFHVPRNTSSGQDTSAQMQLSQVIQGVQRFKKCAAVIKASGLVVGEYTPETDLDPGFVVTDQPIGVSVSIDGQPFQKASNDLHFITIVGYSPRAVPAFCDNITITIGGSGFVPEALEHARLYIGDKVPRPSAPLVYDPVSKTLAAVLPAFQPISDDDYRSYSLSVGLRDALHLHKLPGDSPVIYVFRPVRMLKEVYPKFFDNDQETTANSSYGLISGLGFPPLNPGADENGKQIVVRPRVRFAPAAGGTSFESFGLMTSAKNQPSVMISPPHDMPVGLYQVSLSFNDGQNWSIPSTENEEIKSHQGVTDTTTSSPLSTRKTGKGWIFYYSVVSPSNSVHFDVQSLCVQFGLMGTDNSDISFWVDGVKTSVSAADSRFRILNLTGGQEWLSGDPVALQWKVGDHYRCIQTAIGGDTSHCSNEKGGWFVTSNSPLYPDDVTAIFSIRAVRCVKNLTADEIKELAEQMVDSYGRAPDASVVPKYRVDFIGDAFLGNKAPSMDDVTSAEEVRDFFNDPLLVGNPKDTTNDPYFTIAFNPHPPMPIFACCDPSSSNPPVHGVSVAILPMCFSSDCHPALCDMYNQKNDFTQLSLCHDTYGDSVKFFTSTGPGLMYNTKVGATGFFKLNVVTDPSFYPSDSHTDQLEDLSKSSLESVISALTFHTDAATGLSFAADLPAGRAGQIYYRPIDAALDAATAADGEQVMPGGWRPLFLARQAIVSTSGKGTLRSVVLKPSSLTATPPQEVQMLLLQEQNGAAGLIAYCCVLSMDRTKLSFKQARFITLGDEQAGNSVYGGYFTAVADEANSQMHLLTVDSYQLKALHYTLQYEEIIDFTKVYFSNAKAVATGHFMGTEVTRQGTQGDIKAQSELRSMSSSRKLTLCNGDNQYFGSEVIACVLTIPHDSNIGSLWTSHNRQDNQSISLATGKDDGDWTYICDKCIKIKIQDFNGKWKVGQSDVFFFSLYPAEVNPPLYSLESSIAGPPQQLTVLQANFTAEQSMSYRFSVVDGSTTVISIARKLANDVGQKTGDAYTEVVKWDASNNGYKQSAAVDGLVWRFTDVPELQAGMSWTQESVNPSTWGCAALVGAPSGVIASIDSTSMLVVSIPTSSDGRILVAALPLTSAAASSPKLYPSQHLTPYRCYAYSQAECHLTMADDHTPLLLWKGVAACTTSWKEAIDSIYTAEDDKLSAAAYSFFFNDKDWQVIDQGRVFSSFVPLSTVPVPNSSTNDRSIAFGSLDDAYFLFSNAPRALGLSSELAVSISATLKQISYDYDNPGQVWNRPENDLKNALAFICPPNLQGEGLLSSLASMLSVNGLQSDSTRGFWQNLPRALAAALGTDPFHTGLFTPSLGGAIKKDDVDAFQSHYSDKVGDAISSSLSDDDSFKPQFPNLNANVTSDSTSALTNLLASIKQFGYLSHAVETGDKAFDTSSNPQFTHSWNRSYETKVMHCIPAHSRNREIGPDYWSNRINYDNLQYMNNTVMSSDLVRAKFADIKRAVQDADPNIQKFNATMRLGGIAKCCLAAVELDGTMQQIKAFDTEWNQTDSSRNPDPKLSQKYAPIRSTVALVSAVSDAQAASLSMFLAGQIYAHMLSMQSMYYSEPSKPPPDNSQQSSSSDSGDPYTVDMAFSDMGAILQFITLLQKSVELRKVIKAASAWRFEETAHFRYIVKPILNYIESRKSPRRRLAPEVNGTDISNTDSFTTMREDSSGSKTAVFIEMVEMRDVRVNDLDVATGSITARNMEESEALRNTEIKAEVNGEEVEETTKSLLSRFGSKLGKAFHVSMGALGVAMNGYAIYSLIQRWDADTGAWGEWDRVSSVISIALQGIHDIAMITTGLVKGVSYLASKGLKCCEGLAAKGAKLAKLAKGVMEILGDMLNLVMGVIEIVEGAHELAEGEYVDGSLDLIAGVCFVVSAVDPEPISKAVLEIVGLALSLAKILYDFFQEETPDDEANINGLINMMGSLSSGFKYLSARGHVNPNDVPDIDPNIVKSTIPLSQVRKEFVFTPPPYVAPSPTVSTQPLSAEAAKEEEVTSVRISTNHRLSPLIYNNHHAPFPDFVKADQSARSLLVISSTSASNGRVVGTNYRYGDVSVGTHLPDRHPLHSNNVHRLVQTVKGYRPRKQSKAQLEEQNRKNKAEEEAVRRTQLIAVPTVAVHTQPHPTKRNTLNHVFTIVNPSTTLLSTGISTTTMSDALVLLLKSFNLYPNFPASYIQQSYLLMTPTDPPITDAQYQAGMQSWFQEQLPLGSPVPAGMSTLIADYQALTTDQLATFNDQQASQYLILVAGGFQYTATGDASQITAKATALDSTDPTRRTMRIFGASEHADCLLSIDENPLFNFTYADNVLTWSVDDGNAFSGKLTVSKQICPRRPADQQAAVFSPLLLSNIFDAVLPRWDGVVFAAHQSPPSDPNFRAICVSALLSHYTGEYTMFMDDPDSTDYDFQPSINLQIVPLASPPDASNGVDATVIIKTVDPQSGEAVSLQIDPRCVFFWNGTLFWTDFGDVISDPVAPAVITNTTCYISFDVYVDPDTALAGITCYGQLAQEVAPDPGSFLTSTLNVCGIRLSEDSTNPSAAASSAETSVEPLVGVGGGRGRLSKRDAQRIANLVLKGMAKMNPRDMSANVAEASSQRQIVSATQDVVTGGKWFDTFQGRVERSPIYQRAKFVKETYEMFSFFKTLIAGATGAAGAFLYEKYKEHMADPSAGKVGSPTHAPEAPLQRNPQGQAVVVADTKVGTGPARVNFNSEMYATYSFFGSLIVVDPKTGTLVSTLDPKIRELLMRPDGSRPPFALDLMGLNYSKRLGYPEFYRPSKDGFGHVLASHTGGERRPSRSMPKEE